MISVSIQGVSKSYGKTVALSNVSIQIDSPGIYGIVGSNGSGKTTLLKVISGLALHQSGEVKFSEDNAAMDLSKFLLRSGFLLSTPRFRRGIRGVDLLKLTSKMKGGLSGNLDLSRIAALTRCEGFVNDEIRYYSRGMLQRLLIANSIIGNPDFVILDEPTSGLDPESRGAIHDVIGELNDGNRTILITSHDLWEVESLCSRAIILESGKLIHDWIDLTNKSMAYISFRNKRLYSEIDGIRLTGTSGESILSVQIEYAGDIIRNYNSEIDFFRIASALPGLYLYRETGSDISDESHEQVHDGCVK